MSISKRLFDILFSFLTLSLGWPIFLCIALLIKCSSKGPVFYGSLRVGLHGHFFICWKFRTMHPNAPDLLEKILAENSELRLEWQKNYKLREDSRVTTLGRWLRKTSLDELPQFWNVLKGELSVVGPRPVTLEEAELFRKRMGEKLFCIRPGLTGLWQTSERSNMSYEERITLEERYIDEMSFIKDLMIIVKTVPLVFFSKEAF